MDTAGHPWTTGAGAELLMAARNPFHLHVCQRTEILPYNVLLCLQACLLLRTEQDLHLPTETNP
jgi:hypothetical protein